MYARWFLYTLGKSETKAYIVNGLLMLASFFIFRNVIGVGALATIPFLPPSARENKGFWGLCMLASFLPFWNGI